MNQVEYEDGYIYMYAISVCNQCLQAFDTCDAVVYLSSFDGEELQADCPYCDEYVYVEAYFSDIDETV